MRSLMGIFVGLFLVTMGGGCASTECAMVAFAPTSPSAVYSSEEVLMELNTHLPYEISEQDFSYNVDEEGIIGWVAFAGKSSAREFTSMLNRHRDFTLLSVGYFDARDRHLFRVGCD